MDLSITHQQSQRLLKQRDLLAVASTLLFGVSVLLTLAASSRDREVVLQPVLARPLTLSSSHIDRDYLELVTRDAALLTLNRSPSNLQYWMDAILEITDTQFLPPCDQPRTDIVERFVPIDMRLARAEQIEVGAVEQQNARHAGRAIG